MSNQRQNRIGLLCAMLLIGASVTGLPCEAVIADESSGGKSNTQADSATRGNGASRIARLTASFEQQGVQIREQGQPVLFYQREPKSLDGKWRRASYIHPVNDLQGRVMTEDFPKDHPHHRGIFWAWHQVWVGDQRLGDSWTCQDFDWDVRSISVNSPASPLIIESRVHWKSPSWTVDGIRQPVVDERTRITVHHTSAQSRCIDFDISLRALVEGVRIGGSEDDKGYGGFSPRIIMTPSREFRFASGTVVPTKTAILAGPWVDIRNQENGVTIMTHPDNPMIEESYPWILRTKRSMQNAVYPGREPVPLGQEIPTRLRYRMVIHDGARQTSELQQLFDDYVRSSR